ncbi:tetratricopeptide repeat protein [Methanothermococcus sp. SCGC AD-155-E23]|nr:tetratricopeptide repeat protein [Methanothermococcus sp. SCGC AD-155-E23]
MISKVFRIFKKKSKDKTVEKWLSEGDILYEQGRYEEALEYFDKVLEINPNCADAWSRKGLTLARLGRYEEAIRCFDKSLSIRNDFEIIWAKKKVEWKIEEKNIEKIIEDTKKEIAAVKSRYNVEEAEDIISMAEEAFKRGYRYKAKTLALEAKERVKRISKLAKEVEEIMKDVRDIIFHIKSRYNIKEAEDILNQAEEAFKDGGYSKAGELALKAREKAVEVRKQAEKAEKLINEIKETISQIKSQYDVKEMEDILNQAEEAFKRGEYYRAEKLALKVKKNMAEIDKQAENVEGLIERSEKQSQCKI